MQSIGNIDHGLPVSVESCWYPLKDMNLVQGVAATQVETVAAEAVKGKEDREEDDEMVDWEFHEIWSAPEEYDMDMGMGKKGESQHEQQVVSTKTPCTLR
eukprot:TRINITY_DN2924_c0_g2_i1.p2 TRINITY_DN2924_c0_g2~~TRINITY_DN2924_c0_g2_i1.p2  ORF type:complete len:100 (-),score=16.57 TRINITY_DN2924_c0_g2_i1:21-320(-)